MATHLDPDLVQAKARAVSPELIMEYENALTLWLRWNDAHDRVSSEMFESRGNPERIEELYRQADELRAKAVAASRALLGAR
jgi:hypothetical protein